VAVRAKGRAGEDLPLTIDARGASTVRLPEDGEYEIWVTRVSRSRTRSRYTMTVTIR
jgi:hypothetical protein